MGAPSSACAISWGAWRVACPVWGSGTARTRCAAGKAPSMAPELLLDTGPFVALVDRSETRHADCVAALENWTGPVVTTEAVLTETLYLVGPRWDAQRVCFEFFARGAFLLVPSSRESLKRVAAL